MSGPESNFNLSFADISSLTCVPPMSTTSTLRFIARPWTGKNLLSDPYRPAQSFENAAARRLFGTTRGPAFDNLELNETEQGHAGEFQIQPKIARDLGDGTGAVELRGKLRFGHSKPQLLDTLKTIARISRNPGRVIIALVGKVLHLDEAQRGQHPVLDVLVRRHIAGEIGQLVRLLKREPDARGAPELREKLLPIMLDQLKGRIARDQVLAHERDEQWATGLRLGGSRLRDTFGVDVDQRNGGFRAVKLSIARRHQQNSPFPCIQLNVFLRPVTMKHPGELFSADHSQRATERKKIGVAGKVNIRRPSRIDRGHGKVSSRLRDKIRITETSVRRL